MKNQTLVFILKGSFLPLNLWKKTYSFCNFQFDICNLQFILADFSYG